MGVPLSSTIDIPSGKDRPERSVMIERGRICRQTFLQIVCVRRASIRCPARLPSTANGRTAAERWYACDPCHRQMNTGRRRDIAEAALGPGRSGLSALAAGDVVDDENDRPTRPVSGNAAATSTEVLVRRHEPQLR
jgi:hypothetical protein